jgi:hypothetical protein
VSNHCAGGAAVLEPPAAGQAGAPALKNESTDSAAGTEDTSASVETIVDLPATTAAVEGATPEHPDGPEIGDRVLFVMRAADKKLRADAADVVEMSILKPGAVILRIQAVSGSWVARDVRYCGADWKDCHWCWKGEKPAPTDERVASKVYEFTKPAVQ